jgi:predicted MPP superfamily phosphohydrolase
MKEAKRGILTRRNFLRLMAAGAAGAFADALWIEPGWLTVTRCDVPCRCLPAGLDGLRIGLLGDLHFEPDRDVALIEAAIARVNAEKLDLILLAGDYVTSSSSVLVPLVRILGKARASHGVFAVMGNHDGWHAGRALTRRIFEQSGISFLINQNSHLQIGGEKLALAGTDFVWLGKPDPHATLKGIARDTPVLALVHEPDYFDEMTACRDIMLQVSGHTHGGQCRVPVAGYAPAKVKYGERYIYGHHAIGNSNLFVTRGIGTSGLRVRFACPPELAILTLRAEATA